MKINKRGNLNVIYYGRMEETMMEWKKFSAKTVDEALTNALVQLETTSNKVEYEVVEKESVGIFGLFSKPAVIRVRVKVSIKDLAENFLKNVFSAMDLIVSIQTEYDETEKVINIELSGDQMGVLIGKRGATLDSLQYLLSLVINKDTEEYIKVKVDTENYRERRKETLENLANNLAHKVKRIHKPVYLEPMNPYERRVIHSTLQNDKNVETHSEGEEPYRKVVITLKPGMDTGYERKGKHPYNRNGGYNNKKRYNNSYRKPYNKGESSDATVITENE